MKECCRPRSVPIRRIYTILGIRPRHTGLPPRPGLACTSGQVFCTACWDHWFTADAVTPLYNEAVRGRGISKDDLELDSAAIWFGKWRRNFSPLTICLFAKVAVKSHVRKYFHAPRLGWTLTGSYYRLDRVRSS
jgi:hypothetical protein